MPLKQSLASFALYSLDQNIFHHFRPVASPPKVSALERVVDKKKKKKQKKKRILTPKPQNLATGLPSERIF